MYTAMANIVMADIVMAHTVMASMGRRAHELQDLADGRSTQSVLEDEVAVALQLAR